MANLNCGELKNAQAQVEQLFDSIQRQPAKCNQNREAAYNELYLKIASELEMLENALSEARLNVGNGEYAAALSICNQKLEQRPNDPAFQTLKFEAENALREHRARLIADLIRQAEAEADLEIREGILQEASALYPQESYFQQALLMLQNRRSLIQSIIGRATRCEEDRQFNEAIAQWEMLRNVAPQHEAVEPAIARLKERRANEVREQARDRWIAKFSRYFVADDYAKARDVIRDALAEYPDDERFLELDTQIETQLQRRNEARDLLEKSSGYFAREEFENAIEALQTVANLAESSPRIRVALLGVLLDNARKLLGTDWRIAQPFIELAMRVGGDDPVARNLASILDDLRRKATVDEFISEAVHLRERGEFMAAFRKVEGAIAAYPNELRLSQLHNALRSEVSVIGNHPGADERRLKPKARWRPFGRSATPAVKYEGSPKPARGRLRTFAAAAAAGPYSVPTAGVRLEAAQGVLTPPVSEEQVQQATVEVSESVPRRKHSSLLSMVIAGALLALVAVVILVLRGGFQPAQPVQKQAPLAARTVAVHISTDVPGSTTEIDGQPISSSLVALSLGPHRAVSSKRGYKTEAKAFTVSKDSPLMELAFSLAPLPAIIRLQSDLSKAELAVDSNTPVDFGSGSGEVSLSPGHHRIRLLSDREEKLSFVADVLSAEPIKISDLSKRAPAMMVSTFGDSVTLYGNAGWKLRREGGEISDIGPSGFLVPANRQPANELTIVNGSNDATVSED